MNQKTAGGQHDASSVAISVLDGLHSVHSAAERLRLKPDTIYRYFHRGLLKRTLIGRSVFVSEQEIERFSRERKPLGNPNLRKHA